MPKPRSFVGVIVAAIVFMPSERVLGIGIHYLSGRAAQWHQTLASLAVDSVSDLFLLVVVGGLLTAPLWVAVSLLLNAISRRKTSWWMAALLGVVAGWVPALLPCGFYFSPEDQPGA